MFLHLVATSQVKLTYPRPLEPGTSACPGEDVIFTCEVRGADTLIWSSNEYIGAESNGSQLEFTTHDEIGARMNCSIDPENNYAILNQNDPYLQSDLHIRSNQSSRVSCRNINTGSKQSIDFTVLGEGMHKHILYVEV